MTKVSNIVLVRGILGNLTLNAYIHEERPLRVNLGLSSTDVLPLSIMSSREEVRHKALFCLISLFLCKVNLREYARYNFFYTCTYIFPLLIEYCIGKLLDRLSTVMHRTIGADFFLDIVSQSEIFATLVTSCNANAIINVNLARQKLRARYTRR